MNKMRRQMESIKNNQWETLELKITQNKKFPG